MAEPNPFAPILLFNHQKSFDACYSLETPQLILDFFQEIADHLEAYGVPEAHRPDVTMLVATIKGLYDGKLYSDPDPPKQVLRASIKRDPVLGDLILKPTEEIPWTGNPNKEPFYIIFDLIGTLLSLTSTISETSNPHPTPTNYFLPLLTLYAKWCCTLGRVGMPPTVAQVTWFADSRQILCPFFGASIGGLSKNKTKFNDQMRKKRWEYLSSSHMLPIEFNGGVDQSFARTLYGNTGTRYGNCAETYPFLYILKDQDEATKLKAHGIAFDLTKLFTYDAPVDPSSYPKYDGRTIWASNAMLPPCPNCRTLLKASGLDWAMGPMTKSQANNRGPTLPGKYPQFQLYK